MSEFAFRSCLESIESDDYGSFKENFDLGVAPEEAEYLLRVAISKQKKFMIEFLLGKIELSEGQLKDCQVFASTGETLDIFKLFADKVSTICTQAWMNLFNIRPVNELEELLKKYGTPTEDLQPVIQYALANNDPQVHTLAFDRLFSPELLTDDEKRKNLIDSICFSGNLDLLDRLEACDDLKKEVAEKQELHIKFAANLDEYVEMVFQNTPKEKVAQTVNTLNLMEEIKANPQVEDWDIIIQDYLVNEEIDLMAKVEDMSDTCKKMKSLLGERELMLLSLHDVNPSEYKITVKNELENGIEFNLALDRRIFDQGALYICYVVDSEGQKYISSHPMFVLSSKKSLIKLGLRKEKDRKQQIANKKKGKGKKVSSKIKLSSKDVFKFLLGEHIKSRKEIDDSV